MSSSKSRVPCVFLLFASGFDFLIGLDVDSRPACEGPECPVVLATALSGSTSIEMFSWSASSSTRNEVLAQPRRCLQSQRVLNQYCPSQNIVTLIAFTL